MNFDELNKQIAIRPTHTRYIVSGIAHTGTYKLNLIWVKISKGFFSGTDDTSKKPTIHLLQKETITKIVAVDWDSTYHENKYTTLYSIEAEKKNAKKYHCLNCDTATNNLDQLCDDCHDRNIWVDDKWDIHGGGQEANKELYINSPTYKILKKY